MYEISEGSWQSRYDFATKYIKGIIEIERNDVRPWIALITP